MGVSRSQLRVVPITRFLNSTADFIDLIWIVVFPTLYVIGR